MDIRRASVTLATIAVLTGSLAESAAAAPVTPQLKLITASDEVTTQKYGRQPVFLDLGVYVASLGAPFELHASRPDYLTPVGLSQVLHDPEGGTEKIALPAELLDGWSGLNDFFRIAVHDLEGELVKEKLFSFCPSGGYDAARISDEGPQMPTYPMACFGNPFTTGLVWGIDAGWAVNSNSTYSARMRLPVGDYTATLSIEPAYTGLFDIAPEDAVATVAMKVRKIRRGCEKFCEEPPPHSYDRARAVPTMESPDPSILPDLAALPAWGMYVQQGRARTRLTFGATVWTAGASSMVVEGFRRADEAIMDAYQYFYDGDELVGRAPVGELAYDERPGHNHWHFLQFARYSLLDSTQTEVLLSKKEAFCLAPTDAIDLTLPNADWSPGHDGFGTQCGGQTALWVREVLPLGWGDTYFQGIPGQSFNITDLPNGTYYIKVEVNPLGALFEQTDANNAELREVIIGGEPGARTIEVPPWNGIDTEAPYQPGHH